LRGKTYSSTTTLVHHLQTEELLPLASALNLQTLSTMAKFIIALLRIAVFLHSVLALPEANFNNPRDDLECPSSDRIKADLGPRLSSGAAISIPSSPEWDQLVARSGSPRIHPIFLASVQPATEKDVQETARAPTTGSLPKREPSTDLRRSNMRINSTCHFWQSAVPMACQRR